MYNDYVYAYVEDDKMSREIMMLLMDNVLQVDQYVILPDSEDFLNRITETGLIPDYFLLDIHMEPIDGFKMIEIIRGDERFAHTRVIALTASVMNEEIAQLRTAGFDGAIGKPLSIATFPDLLEQVITGRPVWHIV